VKVIQQGLIMEGVVGIKVIGMGETQLFLQLEEGVVLEAVKRNHEVWWEVMFKRVRKWAPPMVAVNISVWLNVTGIPLYVWDEPLLKKIGSLFGVFVDFDEETIARKRLDLARIRIST